MDLPPVSRGGELTLNACKYLSTRHITTAFPSTLTPPLHSSCYAAADYMTVGITVCR